jgi:hypothetical protein
MKSFVSLLWRGATWPLRVLTRGGHEQLVALKRPIADAGEGWGLWLLVGFIAVCALLAVPGAAE